MATILCLTRCSANSTHNTNFLDGFLGDWDNRPSQTILPGDVVPFKDQWVIIHHMQSFVVMEAWRLSDLPEGSLLGVRSRRQTAKVRSLDGGVLEVLEKRYSLALNIFPGPAPFGVYSLTSLVDISEDDPAAMPIVQFSPNGHDPRWDRFAIHPSYLFAGVAALQLHLCSLIHEWKNDWTKTLDALDKVVSVKVRLPSQRKCRGFKPLTLQI